MELKSMEMQIALPRTHDAGKNMQHIQQESRVINENAMQEMEKALDLKRHHVLKQDQKDPAMLKDQGNSKNHHEAPSKKDQEKQKDKEKQIYHPFKGNHIDFSG
ncbi:hypothetical protein [Heyndrickxia camelliae]|uniref:Uncharacterized protein n=1 Tax=Heyndrickxia camelliae TaxID=1707093 RepID=A0A2N3LR01_9BACI|nr:hypothetical protein [Heyndrickxia camelliae]PKR87082.1 hypothetical protein CWO92_03230 [Heyndrickxia camelliae]